VKIWDWEGGEFERTVKGHTKAVMDVDFDPKGSMMGESPRLNFVSDLPFSSSENGALTADTLVAAFTWSL